jgi:hypothetical protein
MEAEALEAPEPQPLPPRFALPFAVPLPSSQTGRVQHLNDIGSGLAGWIFRPVSGRKEPEAQPVSAYPGRERQRVRCSVLTRRVGPGPADGSARGIGRAEGKRM